MTEDIKQKLERLFLNSWHPYAWIVAIGLALYVRTVMFGWSYWDDDHLVLLNYEKVGDLRNIWLAFRTDVNWERPGFYYRPGLTISLMADALWGGLRPWAYHAGNIIQHIITSCLLLALFRRLGCSRWVAFASTALFVVHPVNAQAVAWVPGRNDLLLALFSISSFIAFVRLMNGEGKAWCWLSLAFFAMAVFTKEAGLLLPLVLIWYLVMFERKKLLSKKTFLLASGWIVVGGVFLLVRSRVVYPGVVSFNGAGDNLRGFLGYLGKVLIPVNLSVLPVPQDMKLWPGIASLVGLTGLFLLGKIQDNRRFLFGTGWFLMFLFPMLMRGAGFPNYLEHRMYLPLAGFLLMLQESTVFHRPFMSKLWSIVVPVFFLGLSVINLQRLSVFRDDVSFWRDAVLTSPRAYFSHTVLGQRLGAKGCWEEAEKEFAASLRLNPGDPLVENDLGQVLMAQNKWAEAERAFLSALEDIPGDLGILKNLGQVRMKTGNWVGAEQCYRQVLVSSPDDPETLDRLALACYMQQKYQEAADFYEQAVRAGVEPDPRIIKMLESHITSGSK